MATEETLTQSAKETYTQIAVKSETLTSEEVQIQPVEEFHDPQIVDESKTLILGNIHIPSSNKTWTSTVEGTETKAITEILVLSTEETKTKAVHAAKTQSPGETQNSSAEQTQTQTCADGRNLTRDGSKIQSTELARIQTVEYRKNWHTENSQVRFPEENGSPNTEGSEPQMLKGKDGYLIKTNHQSS